MLGSAAFVAGTVALVLLLGVPYQRDVLAIWLLVGLFCCSLSDVRGYLRGVLVDWLPFIAILIAYDSLRGTAGRLSAVHVLPQLQIDRWLFGGTAPTVTLQHWLWHGHVVWYDVVFWLTYLTHFFATPVVAAVLWKLDRARFRRFAVLVAALSFTGLLTYALYPAAPPWMAAQAGDMSPVTRIIPLIWQHLGLHSAGSLVESGYQYANNVAAVPSLHAAFSLLIAITLWPRRRRVAASARGCVPAADGLLARVHRRALRVRHPARLGVHDRRRPAGAPCVGLVGSSDAAWGLGAGARPRPGARGGAARALRVSPTL